MKTPLMKAEVHMQIFFNFYTIAMTTASYTCSLGMVIVIYPELPPFCINLMTLHGEMRSLREARCWDQQHLK